MITLAVVKLLKLRLSCYVDIVNLRDTWSAWRFTKIFLLLLLYFQCNEGSTLVIQNLVNSTMHGVLSMVQCLLSEFFSLLEPALLLFPIIFPSCRSSPRLIICFLFSNYLGPVFVLYFFLLPWRDQCSKLDELRLAIFLFKQGRLLLDPLLDLLNLRYGLLAHYIATRWGSCIVKAVTELTQL